MIPDLFKNHRKYPRRRGGHFLASSPRRTAGYSDWEGLMTVCASAWYPVSCAWVRVYVGVTAKVHHCSHLRKTRCPASEVAGVDCPLSRHQTTSSNRQTHFVDHRFGRGCRFYLGNPLQGERTSLGRQRWGSGRRWRRNGPRTSLR